MAKDKVKFTISSDGTSKGTKVTLNGENLLEQKKVHSLHFHASAAAEYPDYDGTMRHNPEEIGLGYVSSEKNEKGEKIYSRYSFNLAEDKYEPKVTPLGQAPAEEGDGTEQEDDNLLGQDSKVITEILDYVGKTKRYIPSRDELINRTPASLKDMLEDIKKEI